MTYRGGELVLFTYFDPTKGNHEVDNPTAFSLPLKLHGLYGKDHNIKKITFTITDDEKVRADVDVDGKTYTYERNLDDRQKKQYKNRPLTPQS